MSLWSDLGSCRSLDCSEHTESITFRRRTVEEKSTRVAVRDLQAEEQSMWEPNGPERSDLEK